MKKCTILASLFLCFAVSSIAQDILLLKTSGKVIIGDTTQISTPGNYNLYVQNGILTEKVKVSLKSTADWSDDAFDKTPSLADVAQSILDRSHLVDMPSADHLVKNGYDLSQMDAKLLQQIEWLWQHMIALKQENADLKERLQVLEK